MRASQERFVKGLLLLLTVFFTNCQPAPKDTAASGGSTVRLQSFATIEATPNPVSSGQNSGTTTVTWSTGNYAVGQVYVSVDGEPEKLFARGSAGAADADWVSPDSTCDFRLYTDAEPRVLLATVTVKGQRRTSLAGLARFIVKTISPTGGAQIVLLLAMFAAAYFISWKNSKLKFSVLLSTMAAIIILLALVPVLSSEPRPLKDQPFPDAHELSDATRHLANGDGYVTTIYTSDPRPPRYPPGFPLALSPFAALNGDFPANVQTGAKVFAAFYILAVVFAAWMMGGALAAALAATLIGVSPFARVAATLVMSDAFAASGVVLLIALLHRLTLLRVSLAGLIVGALVAVRLPMVLNLLAVFIALPGKWRKRLVLFAAPPVAALSLWQWATFGSPFRTGYDYWLPNLHPFGLSHAFVSVFSSDGPWVYADVLGGALVQWVCPCPLGGPQSALPNAPFYVATLLGFFWVYAPPFITMLGLFSAWRMRRETTARFTLWLAALSCVFFCFYAFQGIRFMAAPATLLVIFASVMLADWATTRLPDTLLTQKMQACDAVEKA